MFWLQGAMRLRQRVCGMVVRLVDELLNTHVRPDAMDATWGRMGRASGIRRVASRADDAQRAACCGLARNEPARPGPLEVVAADAAVDIEHLAAEVQAWRAA